MQHSASQWRGMALIKSQCVIITWISALQQPVVVIYNSIANKQQCNDNEIVLTKNKEIVNRVVEGYNLTVR